MDENLQGKLLSANVFKANNPEQLLPVGYNVGYPSRDPTSLGSHTVTQCAGLVQRQRSIQMLGICNGVI